MNRPGDDWLTLRHALAAGQLVLVPNQRNRESLLQTWAEDQDQAVWLWPRIEAIDIWLREVHTRAAAMGVEPFCDLQLMNSDEEHLVWLNLVEDSLDSIPLLNPVDTATALSRSYQLRCQWLDAGDAAGMLRQYGHIPDVAAFMTWADQFNDYCRRHSLITLVDLIPLCIKHPHALPPMPGVLLVNFFQPPPLYRQFFEALACCTSVASLECNLSAMPTPALRFEFNDPDGELLACARWAMARSSGDPGARIAIISPDGGQRAGDIRQVFEGLNHGAGSRDLDCPRTVINLAVSASAPVSRTGLITAALAILELQRNDMPTSKFCALLQSPYIADAENEAEARLCYQLRLRRIGSNSCNLSRVISELATEDQDWHSPSLAARMLRCRSQWRNCPARQHPSAWVAHFRTLLEIMGWPGSGLSRREQELLVQWHSLLDQIAGYGNIMGNPGREQMLSRLRGICHRTLPVDASDSADCRIGYFSPEQAIGLAFTHVWILGMSERSWPPPASPDPFLPFELQRRCAMPGSHGAQQRRDCAATMVLLQRGAREQFIVSHSRYVDDSETRPAAAFAQVLPTPVDVLPGTAPTSNAQSGAALELVTNPRFLGLDQPEFISGDSSLPGIQASCAFRALARYRLGARPLDDFVSGLGPAARGEAVHRVMEHFFSLVTDSHQLRNLGPELYGNYATAAVQAAINQLDRRYPEIMTPAFRLLEQHRLRQLLDAFVELERSRIPFQVQQREQKLLWQRGQLRLTIKPDRIDQLADGSLAIVDYKTGRIASHPGQWLHDDAVDLQLPLYQLALEQQQKQPVAALIIARINVHDICYDGIWQQGCFRESSSTRETKRNITPDMEQHRQFWQRRLTDLCDRFIRGEHDVAPLSRQQSCLHCGLEGLCRIGELTREQPEDVEDGEW